MALLWGGPAGRGGFSEAENPLRFVTLRGAGSVAALLLNGKAFDRGPQGIALDFGARGSVDQML